MQCDTIEPGKFSLPGIPGLLKVLPICNSMHCVTSIQVANIEHSEVLLVIRNQVGLSAWQAKQVRNNWAHQRDLTNHEFLQAIGTLDSFVESMLSWCNEVPEEIAEMWKNVKAQVIMVHPEL